MSNNGDNLEDFYDENGDIIGVGEGDVSTDKPTTSRKEQNEPLLGDLHKEEHIFTAETEHFTSGATKDTASDDEDQEVSLSTVVIKPEIEKQRREYFEDDEEFLKGDDAVLLAEPDTGVFEQLDNVVTWELDNFYDESGKQRGRLSLRNDPPVFRIGSSDGSGAEFILSKELSRDLERVFGEVYRGYYGVTPKEQRKVDQSTLRGYVDKAVQDAKTYPLRTALLALFIVFTVLYFIIG